MNFTNLLKLLEYEEVPALVFAKEKEVFLFDNGICTGFKLIDSELYKTQTLRMIIDEFNIKPFRFKKVMISQFDFKPNITMKDTFTTEEIKTYILSQDSLEDVLHNLSSESIVKANEPEEENLESFEDTIRCIVVTGFFNSKSQAMFTEWSDNIQINVLDSGHNSMSYNDDATHIQEWCFKNNFKCYHKELTVKGLLELDNNY